MVSFPDYSHTTPIRIPKDIGFRKLVSFLILFAVTLPETNGLTLKMCGWKTMEDYFHFWDGLVSGAMLGLYL